MNKLKSLFPLMDVVSVGIFGMTIVDLSVMMIGMDYNIITMSNTVKLTVSIISIIYLAVIRIPHAYHINKLNRKEKYLQNELLKQEIEDRKSKKHRNPTLTKNNEIKQNQVHSKK